MEWAPKTKEETEAFLDRVGLPPFFKWNGKQVLPKYQVTRFGKWLRETPYHRGLFAEIHATLEKQWYEIDTADELALALEQRAALRKAELLPGILEDVPAPQSNSDTLFPPQP